MSSPLAIVSGTGATRHITATGTWQLLVPMGGVQQGPVLVQNRSLTAGYDVLVAIGDDSSGTTNNDLAFVLSAPVAYSASTPGHPTHMEFWTSGAIWVKQGTGNGAIVTAFVNRENLSDLDLE